MTEAQRAEHDLVLERLRRHGAILAEAFRLPLRSIDAERPQVRARYGICYDDGSIRIRLRHVRTRELLKYSSMVDTLCHELAHLRHFNHGRRFWALYEHILAYARRKGIYRPGPERPVSGSVIIPLQRPQSFGRPPLGRAPSHAQGHPQGLVQGLENGRPRPPRPAGPTQLELF